MKSIFAIFVILLNFNFSFASENNSATPADDIKNYNLTISLFNDDGAFSKEVRHLIEMNRDSIQSASYLKYSNGEQKYCIVFKSEADSEIDLLASDIEDLESIDIDYDFSPCRHSKVTKTASNS